MLLTELAQSYEISAGLVYTRICELKDELAQGGKTPIEAYKLRRRICELYPMYNDCREMAAACRNYYKKDGKRHERRI